MIASEFRKTELVFIPPPPHPLDSAIYFITKTLCV
jgi:hypothetical protein